MRFAVFPSTYRNPQHGVWRSYCSFFKNIPGTFFNARHQVKAIAIGVSEVNPLVEIGDCCSCVHLHLHVFFPTNPQNRYKGLSLNTNFYIALYSTFCGFIGITFNNITFQFKIDHDDSTVSTDYATQRLHRNNRTIGISSIGIQTGTVLIRSLRIVSFDLFCSYKHT